MDTLDFVTVPIIVTIVYGGITLLKKATDSSEKVLRCLPLIAAALGAVLGIAAFFTMPEIIPASNAFAAVLIGGASGLAATGTNQIFKQLSKFGINIDVKTDGEDKGDDEKNENG